MAALPQYHAHLAAHRYTLLCRFFGLHRVTPRSGKHVYFVVMGNVFPIDRPVHERYDLKGSTLGRETTSAERLEPGVVCKDVDWIKKGRRLHLGADKKRRLLAQVQKDCALLERMEVIDYSLLVGVHQTGAAGGSGAAGRRLHKVGQSGGGNGAAAEEAEAQRRAAVRILDTVSRQQLQEEALRRGGGGADPPPAGGAEAYFVGVIDILCEYGLKKQLEHHYKAAKHGEKVGAQNFSVVDPLQYSTRFQNFVAEALD